MSDTASKSVHKGILKLDSEHKFNIAVYKGVDLFELPGSLYHEDCNGKIFQKQFCEKHPSLEQIVTYSAIFESGKLIRLTGDIKAQLLDRNCQFEFEYFFKSSMIPALLLNIAPIGLYHVTAYSDSHKNTNPQTEFHTLLERMRKEKVSMLVTCPIGGMKRYAIMLHNGVLLPLLYVEEVRDIQHHNYSLDKDLDKSLATFIRNNSEMTFPTSFSLSVYTKRVAAWFRNQLAPKPKNTYRKLPAKAKAHV